MSTITTLNSGDSGPVSRGVINTNLANLNTDKIETSVISTDGTLAGNSDTELPTEKAVKTYVDNNFPTIETTSGATHSLTTVAGQVVVVWAKADISESSASATITLKYNGVTKDTAVYTDNDAGSKVTPIALMYTETPGAATQNVTVETSTGSLSNVKIIVMKL